MLDIWEPFRNWLLVFKTQVSSCTVGVEVLRMRRVVTWVHAVLEVTCTDDVPGKVMTGHFPPTLAAPIGALVFQRGFSESVVDRHRSYLSSS